MMLNLPREEQIDNSELKRTVAKETKHLANRILIYLSEQSYQKTDMILEKGNELLSHLPQTSVAYLPSENTTEPAKKLSIPKTSATNVTTRAQKNEQNQAQENAQTPEELAKPRKFHREDDVMITIRKLVTPKRIEPYQEWIEALKTEKCIPKSWVSLLENHLPEQISVTYKNQIGSQTNLRTNKNWILHTTKGYNQTPTTELTLNRPMELIENIFKLQEVNLLREVVVDADPLREFKLKTSRPSATEPCRNLAAKVQVKHLAIIGIKLEDAQSESSYRQTNPLRKTKKKKKKKKPKKRKKKKRKRKETSSEEELGLSQIKKRRKLRYVSDSESSSSSWNSPSDDSASSTS